MKNNSIDFTNKVDEGLVGNELIEKAVKELQNEATQEMLAHTLTVIRKRMKQKGQFVIAVEPSFGLSQMNVSVVKTADGINWWTAFTSFDEEMKGGDGVKSTFLTDIEQLLRAAVSADGINGIILNPWNRTIMLDKTLINIILG
ncbi:SseB family protein [Eubacterium sp. MSJ-13]|uniref:SseB family protein n=1 Tax=Eubacterium sp. MSJ-13 TaxID=2841513 RepID=UPI001C1006CD|nr:SseB family protein [Eubacterium sp. MSJ-13]MBU5478520.1 SseB family protein [Eubacterium sp. MSJ-13]